MDGRGRDEVVFLNEGEEFGGEAELVEVETGSGRLHLFVGKEVVDLHLVLFLPRFDVVGDGRGVVGVEVLRERLVATLAANGCDQIDFGLLVQKGISVLVVGDYVERGRHDYSSTRCLLLGSFLLPPAGNSRYPPSPSLPVGVDSMMIPALADY